MLVYSHVLLHDAVEILEARAEDAVELEAEVAAKLRGESISDDIEPKQKKARKTVSKCGFHVCTRSKLFWLLYVLNLSAACMSVHRVNCHSVVVKLKQCLCPFPPTASVYYPATL